MVSTRHHPAQFPEPSSPNSPSKALTKATSSPRSSGPWAHTPSNLVLGWLLISLPLVFWDTGYIILRPHSMPGGSLHWPLWVPYALYGTVDYIYGFPAWNAHNGFTAAQGWLNLTESAMYIFYLWTVFKYGKNRSEPPKRSGLLWWVYGEKAVPGTMGALGVLVAFVAANLTFAKTVLYWSSEAFSGFPNIGHNDPFSLIVIWLIPNGLWMVFPPIMSYWYGVDIMQGLAMGMKNSE